MPSILAFFLLSHVMNSEFTIGGSISLGDTKVCSFLLSGFITDEGKCFTTMEKFFSKTMERCRVHLFKSKILLWREHFLDEHKRSEDRRGRVVSRISESHTDAIRWNSLSFLMNCKGGAIKSLRVSVPIP